MRQNRFESKATMHTRGRVLYLSLSLYLSIACTHTHRGPGISLQLPVLFRLFDSDMSAGPRPNLETGTGDIGHFRVIHELTCDKVYGSMIYYCSYNGLHKARAKQTGTIIIKSARVGVMVVYLQSDLRSQQSPVVGMPV